MTKDEVQFQLDAIQGVHIEAMAMDHREAGKPPRVTSVDFQTGHDDALRAVLERPWATGSHVSVHLGAGGRFDYRLHL